MYPKKIQPSFYYVYPFQFFHNGRWSFLRSPPRQETDGDNNYTRWITQNLDHFDVENLKTWQQRYFVKDEFLNQTERNVAFLIIGGESEASDVWFDDGAWTDYAKENNAILFILEHRFYGESQPTEDLSVENLKYLNSQQALADISVFVNAVNAEYNLSPDVKWIAFGISYAGSLAAWLRLKYPHLIHAAVSSSGPLLAVSDFQDYYQVVGDDLLNFNEDCYDAVKKGNADMELLIEDPDGRNTLTNLFRLCSPLEIATDNISSFFESVASRFAYVAQFNDNANEALGMACGIMSNTSRGEEIDRLADFYDYWRDGVCNDYNYSRIIDEVRNTTLNFGMERQWIFQCCNEFGFFQTSDQKPHIFGHHFPLSYFNQQCIDIYGDKFDSSYVDAAVERTNTFYGGMDIEVTNVVFVHGSVDPWHALGITTTRSPDSPAIFINGTSHCADMHAPSDDDPPALKEAREQIGQLIQTWLNQ